MQPPSLDAEDYPAASLGPTSGAAHRLAMRNSAPTMRDATTLISLITLITLISLIVSCVLMARSPGARSARVILGQTP